MEPERTPDVDPRDELNEILREGRLTLRGAADSDAPSAPEDPARPRIVLPRAVAEFSSGRARSGPEVRYILDDRDTATLGARAPEFKLAPLEIFAIGLGAVVTLLWLSMLAAPAFTAPAPDDDSYLEASARWALVLTSQRVEAFRRANERMPGGLEELGYPTSEQITFEPISDARYRLTAPSPSGPLVLDSMNSRNEFLGSSLERLRGPGSAR
jgi:hypothetical protein